MCSHVNKLPQINHHQVFLWGTGLSGGYVLQLASELKGIRAVMAQIPYVDGAETVKHYPIKQLPKALKRSSQDYMGSKIGLKATTLPVVHPFALSFFPLQDGYQGYMSMVHPDYFWSGEVPARVFFHLTRFRPITSVRKIKVPVLMIAAKKDQLTPIAISREAATNMAPFVQYYEWEMSHFDIYHDQWLEKAIATQLEFLNQQMGEN